MPATSQTILSQPASSTDFAVSTFIERWRTVQLTDASELATSQSFVLELCDVLGVPRPTHSADYMFERPLKEHFADGGQAARRIDCYRQGHFVWESKKLRQFKSGTDRFNTAMLSAHAQAQAYARALPAAEGRVPFICVVDVGNVIELYSDFTRSGATYTPFPDPRSHRITLADLAKPELRERLRLVWTDPDALDPSRISAVATREVAAKLAGLAKSMEASGHRPGHVAAFLTRSLFSMFAEDVELLVKGSFLALLKEHRQSPPTLMQMLRSVWADMDHGGFSAALRHDVLHFNGKLFKGSSEDGYSLLLTTPQIDLLIDAAGARWNEVEPAIFGTLLERALDPVERHALGAHYTPRAYVERLVMPTVIEPLRAEWADAQAAAVLLVQEAEQLSDKKRAADKLAEARAEVRRFHHRLCTLRVLDPACGSGNFLYVTLEHLKRLEGEVLNQLHDFGDSQVALGLEGETVTLQQLRGIELNPRAAGLAELVLWIGYLQWQIRTRGNAAIVEPVVHDYGNIECRDAVLAWDDLEPAHDSAGVLLTRWDGRSTKPHPVTGALVPDEAAQVPQWKYLGARKAEWPQADFIVGNPPFIGKRNMRAALGDGYVETLRTIWQEVPDSADFVMYWWQLAANYVCSGSTRRMGLITTNSLRQTFNRRVVQAAMDRGLALAYVIPDHPWVDSATGASVRIAMSVGQRAEHGSQGDLSAVLSEATGEQGEIKVELANSQGFIQADLSIGADLNSAMPLEANLELSNIGVFPLGEGFILSAANADALAKDLAPAVRQRLLREYRNGRDLTSRPRGVVAIDTFGFDEAGLLREAPAVWQWLHDRVKPERDENPRRSRRANWWRYGEDHPRVRRAIAGLPRYIATVMTAKHRVFQFLDAALLPDQKLVVFGFEDAFHLGVLTSQIHVEWALAAGSWLGVGNDPVYVKSRCFETFPFPDDDTGLTPALRERVGVLAERIDAHRKRQQAAHPTLTLTGMYNVLEVLRTPEPRALTAKEKMIHEQGLVGVLNELHCELDDAVLEAYGWKDFKSVGTSALLERLVALNTQRAAEERTGRVRWLRPEFQNPALQKSGQLSQEDPVLKPDFFQNSLDLPANEPEPAVVPPSPAAVSTARPWPATLPEQMRAVADLLGGATIALSLADVESAFKSRGAWKKGLPRILETLEAVGRARADHDVGQDLTRWRSA
jgi:hypothetical protein